MLELVTFTGVDAETDLSELARIAWFYPNVEFGVLVGSRQERRYPSLAFIGHFKRFGVANGLNMSVHLCGRYAREAVDMLDLDGLYKFCEGFNRVQINLPGDAFKGPDSGVAIESVSYLAGRLPVKNVILQHRESWNKVPVLHESVEYLFDKSGGRGVSGFEAWPEPVETGRRLGYAGGIGPDTIDSAMEFVNRHSDFRLWLDMESRIRTDGHYDLGKVKSVCATVWPDSVERE